MKEKVIKAKGFVLAVNIIFSLTAILGFMMTYVHHSVAEGIVDPSQIVGDHIQPTSMLELGVPSNYSLGRRYFDGAVYVHRDFGTINLRGLIDGKDSDYALQTGDTVMSDPFFRNITFKGAVIQRSQRHDYNDIWNQFVDLYKSIRFLDNNDNSNIIEHTSANSRLWLNLGGAQYYFNIGLGEIKYAYLRVLKNKTYTLPSGVYFLTSLDLEEGAQLKVNGPVTIFLYSTKSTDELRVEEDASINKNGNPGDFSLLGFNKYPNNSLLPMIEMFKGCQINGTILAPYYQFIIREGVRLEGALFVHNFMMWQQTQPIPPRWQIIYGGPFCTGPVTITVALDGRGDFTSIQAAIDWAENGDVIIVCPGTYYENINFCEKAITVTSEDPDDPNVVAATIIDGSQNGSVVTFEYEEDAQSVLSGFTVQNGGDTSFGGGIYCLTASPTITNCVVKENSALESGGGICCGEHASPIISQCTVFQNSAYWGGGGICGYNYSSPAIRNCSVYGNQASYGGGVFLDWYCSSDVSKCLIENNSASYEFGGGGVFCNLNSLINITNCVITKNLADHYGGGVAIGDNSSANIEYSLLLLKIQRL